MGGDLPDHSPTRKHVRVPLLAKVEIRTAGTEAFLSDYSGNISEGGIFVRTEKPLPVDTTVLLSVVDLTGALLLEARGTVAWSRPEPGLDGSQPAGMGLRFTWLSAGGQALVAAMVERMKKP